MPREALVELNRLTHRLLRRDGPPAPQRVHGYLDLAWPFAPFADALQRRLPASLVAPDPRGHGATEQVGRGGDPPFADDVADLAALLAEKGTRPVDGGFARTFDPLHRTRSPLPFSAASRARPCCSRAP